MIYNNIFSANNRLPNTICRQQAQQLTIATLMFNYLNPGFTFLMKTLKKLNKEIN